MKRLLILLLSALALFFCGCKQSDFSSVYVVETVENLKEHELYGVWTPLGGGDKLTLSYGGAKLGDKSGRWSYGENGVRVQLGGDGAFFCKVTVKNQKLRLELDGRTFVRGETITAHPLTLDNFWNYFELSHTDAWSENDGAVWFSREYAITLKSEYADFYADGVDIKTELSKVYYDYIADYANKSFELTQRDESYTTETVNSRGTTHGGKLVLHTAFLKEGEAFSFAACDNVKITSVSGTLYVSE